MTTLVEEVYNTGKVLRYHANVELNPYPQTLADHQWGCVALLILLNPYPSTQLLKKALFHDAGERWAGDVPYPFKLANPTAAKEHEKVEFELSATHGAPQYNLSKEEELWLKMVDRIECVLFCKLRRPDQLLTEGWKDQDEAILSMADELGVKIEVEEVLGRT